MIETKNEPKVGLGVIIVNKEDYILVGKRKNSIAPYYSIPGGHLELGETFEVGAIREVKEETGLDIKNLQVIAITNNLETYRESGLHYVSIALLTKDFTGILEVKEPDKCEKWKWINPKEIPMPHFDASRMTIECYLEGTFYIKNESVI